MRLAIAIGVLAACGGSKSSSPPTERSGEAADKLWALAPPGVIAAEVLTAHGVTVLDHALVRVDEILQQPDFALLAGLYAKAAAFLGSPKSLADLGFSDDQGLAIFGTDKDAVAILPVTDRGKFVAAFHGKADGDIDRLAGGLECRVVSAGYACTKPKSTLIDDLGKGSMKGKMVGARGDLEVYVGPSLLGEGLTEGFFSAVLDDGVIDVHGFLAGKIPAMASLVGVEGLKPESNGGGFLLANFAPGLAELGSRSVVSNLAKAIKGPIAATMEANRLAFQARMPLNDVEPVKQILDNCDAFGALIRMPATAANGACHISVPGALVPIGFDAWLDGKELRLGNEKGTFDATTGKPRTAIGEELASGAWPFALWGRGSMFGMDIAKSIGPLPSNDFQQQLDLAVRVLAQFSELGAGARVDADGIRLRLYARTIWTNPTDVARAVTAIDAAALLSGKGDQVAANIAKEHPGTPFAADFDAGRSLMAPVATIGVLSAVAIPAFLGYMQKSKQVEAKLMLNRLGKSAKVAYITDGKFLVGDAPLTPATSCCAGPKGHCVTTAADWSTPVWSALGFSIDQPNLFQYGYASDGKTFLATAVGDLDCDGTMITYSLHGTSENGNPKVDLTEPPPNSD